MKSGTSCGSSSIDFPAFGLAKRNVRAASATRVAPSRSSVIAVEQRAASEELPARRLHQRRQGERDVAGTGPEADAVAGRCRAMLHDRAGARAMRRDPLPAHGSYRRSRSAPIAAISCPQEIDIAISLNCAAQPRFETGVGVAGDEHDGRQRRSREPHRPGSKDPCVSGPSSSVRRYSTSFLTDRVLHAGDSVHDALFRDVIGWLFAHVMLLRKEKGGHIGPPLRESPSRQGPENTNVSQETRRSGVNVLARTEQIS